MNLLSVIEEFDDDTELALPNRSLPNTGTRGAILEALSDDEDGDSEPGPATPSYTHFQQREAADGCVAALAAGAMAVAVVVIGFAVAVFGAEVDPLPSPMRGANLL